MPLPLLDDLPEAERRRVIAVARRRRFARDEILFHEADPANAVHLIAKGFVAVQLTTPLGQTAMLDVLGAGDVVGEMALFDGNGERTATARALAPTETLMVSTGDVRALRAAHPPVADALLALLAHRLKETSARLVETMYAPADARVRRRLLRLAALYGGAPPVVVPLAQEDLAGLAGTTRATTNRVLRDEAARGAVRLGRNRIEVLDLEGLGKRAR